MAARFWVGGTGNWDAATTTHWSATSGGAGGASVPTSADDVTFDANSGTAATVTITVGANANSITLNKSDLTLLHNAGSTVVGQVALTSATLNTNGQTCSWGSFSMAGGGTSTLTLGASSITLTASAAFSLGNNPATFTANTATMTLTAANAVWAHNLNAPFNYNGLSVVVNASTTFAYNGGGSPTVGTFANFTVNGGADISYVFRLQNANITCTGRITLAGNSLINRLLVVTDTPGTTRTLTAALVTLTNVDFMDIAGAGAAAPFTGTSLGDCGGNSGITFTTPATQTFAGGTKNWSDVTAWTSRIPLPQDNVTINTAGGSLTADMPRLGASINCTGFTGTLTLNGAGGLINIYGSFTLATGMTYPLTGVPVILSGRSSYTLTSATKIFGSLTITAPGGTYTLGDDFVEANASSNRTVTLLAGTFNANGKNVTAGSFLINGNITRAATLGSGTWNLFQNFSVNSTTGLTFSGASSTIIMAAASTFNGAGLTYGTLKNVVNASITITGGNTFATLDLECSSSPCTIIFPAGSTQTVTGTLTLSGATGLNRLFVTSSNTASQATISAAVVAITNTDFADIAGSGAASSFTGTSLGDALGNSGITFTASSTQTWQGTAGGNWSDVTKWTSRVPLPQDDVIVNAAFAASQTVSWDMPRLGRTIDFSGATGAPKLSIPNSPAFTIFGSFKVPASMTTQFTGGGGTQIILAGRSSYTLDTNNVDFGNVSSGITISAPGGTYTLASAFLMTSSNRLSVNLGTFATAGWALTVAQLLINAGTCDLGSSTVTISGTFIQSAGTGQLITSLANIIYTATSGTILLDVGRGTFAPGYTFASVTFKPTGTATFTITGNNTYGTLDLECTTAKTITLPASGTQTVTRMLILKGAAGQNLSLASSTPGTATTIIPTGAVAQIEPATVTLSGDITMTVANKGAYFAFTGVSSTQYTASAWVTGAGGGTVRISLFDMVTGKQSSSPITLSSSPQRISVTATTGAASSGFAVLVETDVVQAARTFTVDGVQVEQKPSATPYVETNGSTASRGAAQVTGNATQISEVQSWVALRVRTGFSSVGANGPVFPTFFSWASPSFENQIEITRQTSINKWELQTIRNNAAAVKVDIDPGAFSVGTYVTLIAYWTNTTSAFSVNGSSFSTAVRGAAGGTAMPATFGIGQRNLGGPALWCDSDILWSMWGTGILTNTDAATLNALGNTAPTFITLPTTSVPTMLWDADTSLYLGDLTSLYDVRLIAQDSRNRTQDMRLIGYDIGSITKSGYLIGERQDSYSLSGRMTGHDTRTTIKEIRITGQDSGAISLVAKLFAEGFATIDRRISIVGTLPGGRTISFSHMSGTRAFGGLRGGGYTTRTR